MNPEVIRQLGVWGVLVPGALGMLLLGVAWGWRGRRRHRDQWASVPATTERFLWVLPVLLAAAVWIAALGPLGTTGFPPGRAAHWHPLIALGGMTLGVLAAGVRLWWPARWAVRGVLFAGAAYVPWMGGNYARVPKIEDALGVIALASAGLVGLAGAARITDDTHARGPWAAVSLWAWCAGAAIMLIAVVSVLNLGQMAGAMAAGFGAAAVWAGVRPGLSLARGGAHVPSMVLTGLLAHNALNSSNRLPLGVAVAVLVAPAVGVGACWLFDTLLGGRARASAGGRWWARGLLTVGAVLAVIAAAAGAAVALKPGAAG
ncbi:MAG: hypothetical protein C0513_03100 [Isosphaera sp.]|nr:hypothetical protein [Isosphaera sp.]